jgi:predicted transcriptional regulator
MRARSNRAASGVKVSRRAPNNLQHLREELLLTKAELARKAGVSPLTVARVESGLDCRMDTKRKIILALGLQPSDKAKVFGNSSGRGPGRRG